MSIESIRVLYNCLTSKDYIGSNWHHRPSVGCASSVSGMNTNAAPRAEAAVHAFKAFAKARVCCVCSFDVSFKCFVNLMRPSLAAPKSANDISGICSGSVTPSQLTKLSGGPPKLTLKHQMRSSAALGAL